MRHVLKKNKRDEFYTQLTDIEKEIKHYTKHFKGATVFCNCDDPTESHFFRFFANNFDHLGLKKLVTTHFDGEKSTYKLEITRGLDVNEDGKFNEADVVKTKLRQNGDFRSPESVELLKEADIVVTNPPFSLFREYITQLVEHQKKFLVLGNMNAVTYKEIFALVKEGKMWWGASLSGSNDVWFSVPDSYAKPKAQGHYKKENGISYHKLRQVVWYTNLDFSKRHEMLDLWKKYTEEEYPKYDNYDAINVNKVAEIPEDYDGIMGVPITFIDKYNPDQFEIIGMIAPGKNNPNYVGEPLIKGEYKYRRIAIQSKKGEKK